MNVRNVLITEVMLLLWEKVKTIFKNKAFKFIYFVNEKYYNDKIY